MLSVFVVLSVVLSVSVESAMKCQVRVTVEFCVVSSSGAMRSATLVLLEETAFSGNASL